VGGVCSLHDKLNWFEKKPLLGKGVVVTRAREQASGLVDILGAKGACVYEFPTISVEHIDDYADVETAILGLAGYDWLVFTSVNGVKFFWEQMETVGLDTRILGGIQVAAIGPATADALREKGVNPDFIPEKYVAEHVVDGLLKKGIQGSRVLIPRARVAREILPEKLSEAGCDVQVLPVYETRMAGSDVDAVREAMKAGKVQYVTFTSSSTVQNFFELMPPEEFKTYEGVKIASIGPITSKTVHEYGFTVAVRPEEYTIPGLVEELLKD
jgi:uroporphyrinogen III methyltransferase/synthase